MLQGWFVIAVALCYIGLLFIVASYGDRRGRARDSRWRVLIYPFSLAIYCTSWTFFGSVGLAASTGFEFLTIYIGPILMIGIAWPLVMRVVRLAKAQNITSIADFIAARYGKRQAVAATVASIAIVGSIPYIALQLKAVSASIGVILAQTGTPNGAALLPLGDMALFVALAMAAFTMLFGTRHVDATEHQDGLMLAIAGESMVKLLAFLAVGIFVTFVLFDGPGDLFAAALQKPETAALITGEPRVGSFVVMTLLSFFAIILLPRQFHVTVVENHNEKEIRRAAWMFPVYLVLINLFVVPIALAGLLTFGSAHNSDMFVLQLPLARGSDLLALTAFIGGLSAATAMVIVETVALSIMVSNDIVVPFILKRSESFAARARVGDVLLTIRRIAILTILGLAYLYYRSTGETQLASIGLLSFAAVAQLAPAFFGGLFWRAGTARGALAGMIGGILVWAYTLLLPSFVETGIIAPTLLSDGPWGIAMLRPQALFGIEMSPLAHGVLCSLLVNVVAYLLFSLQRAPSSIERLQADLFTPTGLAPMAPTFRRWRSSVTVEELTATIARYLGEKRTRSSFESFAAARRISLDPRSEADVELMRYAEHLLASGIGAASSRLVLSLLLRKRTVSTQAALKLLDDASAAIHYNREILQTALDHVHQGIAVFDSELHLVCWNRQFGEILDLPPSAVHVGVQLADIVRFNAEHGAFGHGETEAQVAERVERYARSIEPFLERFPARNLVVEVRSDRMPGGGIVITLTDITPSVKAAEALERANASLEERVRERTKELERLNTELLHAKATADEANLSKTRFLAAASHDLLQPLNAARLYVTSLVERHSGGENAGLVGNIDASLEAVEEILGALLDISRLDSGVMKPEVTAFRIDELLRQLELEFAPLARKKGLELTFVASSLAVRSDRRLLRRLLQNLVSNAVKYTPKGRVLVGCRRRGGRLRIEVHDTGIGIPKSKQRAIFQEFHRLEQGAKVARGLGLGMSIVERIARVLGSRVDVASTLGKGSHFSVEVPLAPAIAATAPRRPAPMPEFRPLAEMCVLCIDNEIKILDGMNVLLGGWGCHVLKAASLEAAIAEVEKGQMPVGVLVDYHLDRGNGIEAIRALRARFGDLPAILITADRSPEVRREAETFDMQVLHKPVKPASLRALLSQWRVQRIAAAE
ncbi:MAG TPA: PAS domain-containing hybrid sensor histidine kinase/response regulator [Xanthobacteraceae bacterium]|nr:PAS domain-containing hybrid sensor histidine kinase/response regulator [Xanthobacteraceae bacterium]